MFSAFMRDLNVEGRMPSKSTAPSFPSTRLHLPAEVARGAPASTDPGEQSYRTGFLPQVMTPSRLRG